MRVDQNERRQGRLYRERVRTRLAEDAILQAAGTLLSLDDRIEGAVLFGSYARNRVRGRSDLDLAILTTRHAEPVSLEERLEWQDVLSGSLGGYPVDVIVLARAPLLLCWNISREGRLLLERRPGAWREFQRRTLAEWRDRAWVRERFRGRFLQRWDEGGFGERYRDGMATAAQMQRVREPTPGDPGQD